MNLNEVKSGFNLSKMNENFKKIQEAFNEDVLYRDVPAGQPNQMENDLDMNNHRIYNTSAPKGPYDLVRVIDVQEMGGTVVPGPPPAPTPAPPGPGGDYLRIAVIGDSLSGQQGLFDSAWPHLLERSLNASGAHVQVRNFAINGYTYFSAANTAVFGAKTMLQAAIEYNPQVVIVAMGANDSFRAGQVGGVSQVIAEAQALFTALRAALPTTPIFYGSTSMYDPKHVNLNALVNRHILPAWWQKKTSGLLAGLWCKDIQGDPVDTDIRAAMQYWTQLDNNVRSFPEVNGTIILPLWSLARLGLVGADGLHPGAIGHKMFCGVARKFLQNNSSFRNLLPDLSDQGGGEYNDFDLVFDGIVTDNGTEYITKSNPSVFVLHTMKQFGPWTAELADSWFYPSKGSVISSNLVHDRKAPQVWMIRGSKPNTIVQVTGNETSWLPTNLQTDSRGDAIECGSYEGLPNGNYTLRYRVDDEAYGPLTINVSGAVNSGFAKTDGSNAVGTWPISISGDIQMANLKPIGGVQDVITWAGNGWAPRQQNIQPGWMLQYDGPNVFRIFPVTENVMRFLDGAVGYLPANGLALGVTHSGEWTAQPNADFYVFYSHTQNRLHFANTLPVGVGGVYTFPGDPSFLCLGKIRTNASGQLQDTDTFRGVCSTYNQAPRTLRIPPMASDQGLTTNAQVTIGSATYISAFPGAVVDWQGFGQAGSAAAASYNRASFTHDPSCSSTVGGDAGAVASHSIRSITQSSLSSQTVSLISRCTAGTTMAAGSTYGIQARGVIHHNW